LGRLRRTLNQIISKGKNFGFLGIRWWPGLGNWGWGKFFQWFGKEGPD